LGQGLAGKVVVERRTISELDFQKLELDSKAEGFIAYHGMPLIANGQLKGVLEVFYRKSLKFDEEWLDFFETLGGQTAIAIDRITLFEALQQSNLNLQLAYDATIEGWSRALELGDRETVGHSLRVTEITLRLARVMGVPEADLIHIRRGALLHDIGKLGISTTILLKPDKLSDEEWQIMKQHPQYAYDMLSPIVYLRQALDIPYYHHEKWDGTGYPRGLKGEEIPLAARLFALADVWDALASNRPYHKSWLIEQARDYIREQSGKHFDPQVTEVFLQIANDL
jgi:putative nucleotidyltransferase with HDIG domain